MCRVAQITENQCSAEHEGFSAVAFGAMIGALAFCAIVGWIVGKLLIVLMVFKVRAGPRPCGGGRAARSHSPPPQRMPSFLLLPALHSACTATRATTRCA
jgi:hypothetical protein